MMLWRLFRPRVQISGVVRFVVFFGLLSALLPSCALFSPKLSQQEITQHKETIEVQYIELLYDASNEKMQGNLKNAVAIYQACLQLKPNSATPLYELAVINITLNKLPLALEQAKKAASIAPKNKWFQLLLAELFIQTENLPGAINVYKNLADQYPANSEYAVDLALLLVTNGNIQQALVIYEQLEKSKGPSEQILMNQLNMYQMLKDRNKIAETLKKLVRLYPTEAKYYGLYADYLLDNKEYDKALEQYKQVLKVSPNNGLVHLSLANMYIITKQPNKVFGELQTAFKNPDLAVETKLRAMMQLAPPAKDSVSNTANEQLFVVLKEANPEQHSVYRVHADYLIKQGDYHKARINVKKALTLNHSSLKDWEQLLNLDLELKDNDFLIEDCEQALEYFPNQGFLYFYQGLGYYYKEEFGNAIEILSAGLDMAVGDDHMQAQFCTYLGESCNRLKQYERSDKWFDEALKLDPMNVFVLNNYSYYLSERGQHLDRALVMIEKVLATDVNNGTYLDTYAWILYKQGRYPDAKIKLEKAINHGSGGSAVVVEHYGDVLFKLGFKNEALEQWEKASGLGAGSPLLPEKVKRKELIE